MGFLLAIDLPYDRKLSLVFLIRLDPLAQRPRATCWPAGLFSNNRVGGPRKTLSRVRRTRVIMSISEVLKQGFLVKKVSP